jgi:hypothetical protein
MTTTTNSTTNGRRRPTLSDQIDRLDRTLDGLAEALNEAVADAVKAAVGAAVREAVQATLAEILTNPEVLAALRACAAPPPLPAPPPVPKKPGLWERLGRVCQKARAWLAGLREDGRAGLRRVGAWLAGLWRGAAGGCASLWGRCRSLGQFKYELLAALGVGTAASLAAWFGGPYLAALCSGVGGFAAAVAVQGWLWLRRTLGLQAEQVT